MKSSTLSPRETPLLSTAWGKFSDEICVLSKTVYYARNRLFVLWVFTRSCFSSKRFLISRKKKNIDVNLETTNPVPFRWIHRVTSEPRSAQDWAVLGNAAFPTQPAEAVSAKVNSYTRVTISHKRARCNDIQFMAATYVRIRWLKPVWEWRYQVSSYK